MTTAAEDTADRERSSGDSTVWTGLLIFGVILAIYIVSNLDRVNFYNHFVWQAAAWLQGHAGIEFPVKASATSPGNDYFQDVQPILDAAGNATGRALIPFPPLPALVLLPFVAIFGLTTNAQLIATFIGAIDVRLPSGCSAGCRWIDWFGWLRRCSSVSGRSCGMPPSSARPGSSPMSSPSD